MENLETEKSEPRTSASAFTASIVATLAAIITIIAIFLVLAKNKIEISESKFAENREFNKMLSKKLYTNPKDYELISALIKKRVYEEIELYKLLNEQFQVKNEQSQVKVINERPPISRSSLEAPDFAIMLASIESRLKTLEEGLGNNPEKSLSTPLLKKDVEALQKYSVESVVAMQKEIERIYDQNKWFIGLIATMAVGMIGLALGNLVKRTK